MLNNVQWPGCTRVYLSTNLIKWHNHYFQVLANKDTAATNPHAGFCVDVFLPPLVNTKGYVADNVVSVCLVF